MEVEERSVVAEEAALVSNLGIYQSEAGFEGKRVHEDGEEDGGGGHAPREERIPKLIRLGVWPEEGSETNAML